ncbi:hypothetical protein SG0102_14990 [Intestinibaculum porci]|uniref:N-acetyltransferase domain-containing protein n=2 Tax=Intestinibaculum porci TaxID=2487118 RepID=A0A3G9JDX1_9FIRM|nr:hypothetical protein SG0102_14990 [Intestinibaculum porci]
MQPLQLTDYEKIKPYLEMANYEGYNSNFVNMMMWNHEYHVEYEIHEHFCVMLHNFKGTRYFAMPFTSPDYLKEAVDYMVQYAKDNHFNFMIDFAVPSFIENMKKIYGDHFMFERERDQDDYIYDRQMLETLSGKKMQKRRNHYKNFVKDYPNHEYRALSVDRDFNLILDSLTRWEDDQEASESLLSEVYAILYLLSSDHLLDIKMGGIFIDGELKAFTIASPLNHSTIQMHIEKADKNIRGLYPAICKEFLEHEFPGFQYVNREEDMGLDNLRQAKMQLHPCMMIEKSRVFINDSSMAIANREDLEDVKTLWLDRFEDEDEVSTDFYFTHVYPHAQTYIMRFHNQLVCAITIEHMAIKDHENSYYIMGVATNRKFEHQGCMKKLFQYLLKDYPNDRLYLTAYHPDIYKSLGFKETAYLKRIKLQKSAYRGETDIKVIYEFNHLSDLYQDYVQDFAEYRLRDDDYYAHFLIPRTVAFKQKMATFAKDHEQVGYMIYEETEEELHITEFIYVKDALKDILTYLANTYNKRVIIDSDEQADIEGKSELINAMMCNQDEHDPHNFVNEVY